MTGQVGAVEIAAAGGGGRAAGRGAVRALVRRGGPARASTATRSRSASPTPSSASGSRATSPATWSTPAEAVTGRSLRLAFRVDDEAEPHGRPRGRAPAARRQRPARAARAADPAPRPPPVDRPRPPAPAPAPAAATPARPAAAARRLRDRPVQPPGARRGLEMVAVAGRRRSTRWSIHGGVGLGKTHLLEGIGHALRARHPGLKADPRHGRGVHQRLPRRDADGHA